jgi:hypothetical protein
MSPDFVGGLLVGGLTALMLRDTWYCARRWYRVRQMEKK